MTFTEGRTCDYPVLSHEMVVSPCRKTAKTAVTGWTHEVAWMCKEHIKLLKKKGQLRKIK